MERVRFQRRSMNVLTTGCLRTWYQYDEENHGDNMGMMMIMMLLMMMNERRRRKRRILLQQSCSASGGGRWLLSYFVGPRPQDTCKIAVIIVIMTMITVIPVILITIIVINHNLLQHHHYHHNHNGNNHCIVAHKIKMSLGHLWLTVTAQSSSSGSSPVVEMQASSLSVNEIT